MVIVSFFVDKGADAMNRYCRLALIIGDSVEDCQRKFTLHQLEYEGDDWAGVYASWLRRERGYIVDYQMPENGVWLRKDNLERH